MSVESRGKRPLESIDNTVDTDSGANETKRPQKRSSSANDGLKFTLARIDEDESGSEESNSRSKSSIPVPLAKVPAWSRNPKDSNPTINLKHINSLIGMNQNLNNRKPTNYPASSGINSGDDHLVQMTKLHDEVIDQEIESTMARNHSLGEELKIMDEKIDNLEIDINELKRSNKKFLSKLLEMKSSISSNKRKFEFLEDSVMKNVSNKEKLINIQLMETSNNLSAEFEDFKFELDNQLSIARNFKDDDIILTINNLNARKTELSNKLDRLQQIKKEKINSETAELDKLLTKFLEHKMEKSDEMSTQYELKKNELNKLIVRYNDLQREIESVKTENVSIKEQILSLENSDSNYITVKGDLLNKISTLESSLSNLNKIDNDYSSKLSKTNEIYDSISLKISKQANTKLILENSILNYLTHFCRIYINLPEDTKLNSKDNSFTVDDRAFRFDKLLDNAGRCETLAQFKYFVSSNICNGDLSIVLSGAEPHDNGQDLFGSIIFNCYKQISTMSENLTLNCQAIEITDDSINDFLDSSQKLSLLSIKSPTEIASQIMLLDDPKNFKMILNNTTSTTSSQSALGFSCMLFNVNVQGQIKNRHVDSNVSFLKMSDNDLSRQANMLGANADTNASIKTTLQYFKSKTKCFHFCQLKQVSNLNNAFILLQNLESLYNS